MIILNTKAFDAGIYHILGGGNQYIILTFCTIFLLFDWISPQALLKLIFWAMSQLGGKNTWKTTRCSKLQKSTTRYKWELPFFKLSRSLILSIVLNVRRSSQSTRWIWPRSYLFTSFSNRSNSPRSCLGT